MFLSNKVRTAVETQDILFGPHKYKRAVWRLGPHKDRHIGVTVHVCMCVCLPLSSFVTLRSMRKLRMAVKMPSAAYPYHSIPHTAPKQHLSFSRHSTDTNMCVNFPEDWFVSYIMPEKRFSLRAMQGFFLNRAFYYFFSIRQTVAAFYCRNLIKVNKTIYPLSQALLLFVLWGLFQWGWLQQTPKPLTRMIGTLNNGQTKISLYWGRGGHLEGAGVGR